MERKASRTAKTPTSRGLNDPAKAVIREALKVFPTAQMDAFIADVNTLAANYRVFLSKSVNRTYDREEKEKALTKIRRVLPYLRRFRDRDLDLFLPPNFSAMFTQEWRSDPENDHVFREEIALAFEALRDLSQRLEKHLESIGRPRGIRASADETQLVHCLALAFKQHLARPTFYVDGPFFNTVRVILSDLGLPSEDPSRAIKSALSVLPE